MSFQYSLCNEIFQLPIEQTIRRVAALGYDGIEIAPFTIADSVDDIPSRRRKEILRAAEDAGIEVVGLHWLLASPRGLHITTPERAVRQRTVRYLQSVIHFCADLGGKVLVFGSPEQRNVLPGDDHSSATSRLAEGVREVTEVCAERNVLLLLEPLNPIETNILQTVEEARALADQISHPQVGYILDCKAMSGMPKGIIGTIEEHGKTAGYFHANEPNGLAPGMGDLDFRPILSALKESGYNGWISTEPFNYEPDPTTVARTALETLRRASEHA